MCLEKEKDRNISGQNITEGQKKKHQKNLVQTKTGHYINYNNCKIGSLKKHSTPAEHTITNKLIPG